ncbi:MAG: 2-oxoacid:acceptor oxidoreductase family protein [Candidatus Diapherotrites archaeon]|nr:2-oxoacid:acceptor oxidoreductase family protein [Candidatus Diapherotrites archaeon]
MYKIRIHGRGGQGGKLASKIIGSAAFLGGHEVQDFARYGAERRGAPVESFVRIDDKEILERGYISDPDCVIVLDESLLDIVDVTAGLKKGGLLIINSKKKRIPKLEKKGFKVVTVDATEIAIKHLGKPIYNTAMIGAFAGLTKLVDSEHIEKALEHEIGKKVGMEFIRKNMDVVHEAFKTVEGKK